MKTPDILKKVASILAGICLALLFTLPYILFREQIREMQTLGYVGLVVSCAISSVSILLPTSSTLIVVAAASILNPWICVLLGGIGVAIGEQASYICGRIGVFGFQVTNGNAEKNKKVISGLRRNAFLTIFLFALIPLPIFDLVGIASGAMRIPWPQYALAAVIGKIVRFFIVMLVLYYFLPMYVQLLPEEISQSLEQFMISVSPVH